MTITNEKDIPLLNPGHLVQAAIPLRLGLLKWYRRGRRPLPWRLHWQKHQDPYHIWLSEVMLQQTVIKAVIPVYERFLLRFPTIYTLAQASEEVVKQTVAGLGYYRRFRLLHQAARQLTSQYPQATQFRWPATLAEWQALPGVGDYTAAAVSSIAFQIPAAVVDGNVERVFCRLLDIQLPPNLAALKKQFKLISQELIDPLAPGDYNQALMELGQRLCTVEAPSCGSCPLKAYCLSYRHQSTSKAPQPKIKKAKIDTHLRLIIIKDRDRYALFERPLTAKFLKETCGFLTEVSPSLQEPGLFHLDGTPKQKRAQAPTSLGSFRHSITHHRIVAEVCLGSSASIAKGLRPKWYTADELSKRFIASLDRKAWQLYCASLV